MTRQSGKQTDRQMNGCIVRQTKCKADIELFSSSVLESAAEYLEYFHGNVANVEQFDAEFAQHMGLRPDGTTKTSSSRHTAILVSEFCGLEAGKAIPELDSPIDLSFKSAKRKKNAASNLRRKIKRTVGLAVVWLLV